MVAGQIMNMYLLCNKCKVDSFFILIIGLSVLWFQECSTEPKDEHADAFTVETIQGVTVEEFPNKFSAYEWPLAIDLANGLIDSAFAGQVRLAHLGWTPIDRNCTEPCCFIVDVKGKLDPVEHISFWDVTINSNNMRGSFANAGPTIDTGGFSFTAVRE